MTKPPFMLGRAAGTKTSGRKDRAAQQKAMEAGIDEVSVAIQALMNWPETERNSRLERLSQQIQEIALHSGEFSSSERFRRLQAAEQMVELLKRVSVSKC